MPAHHIFRTALLLIAGGFAVKRQCHGIQQGRFSCASGASDRKNATTGERFLREIDDMLPAQRIEIAEFDAENFHCVRVMQEGELVKYVASEVLTFPSRCEQIAFGNGSSRARVTP